jgi:hypothetical protein
MFLVQILLPLYDPRGRRFARSKYASLRKSLIDNFGGATIFSRAPAEGVWDRNAEEGTGGQKGSGTDVVRDDIVIFETMAERIDRAWWKKLRVRLEKSFSQDHVLIRATEVEEL